MQVMPSCWKADPRESVHSCRNRGEGFVEDILPEEQNTERKLVLPETIYNLTGKEPVIFVKNHTKVKVDICPHQRLGTIYRLENDKRAWLKEELRGSYEP